MLHHSEALFGRVPTACVLVQRDDFCSVFTIFVKEFAICKQNLVGVTCLHQFVAWAWWAVAGLCSAGYQSSFTAITASRPAAARPASHAVTVPDATTATHKPSSRPAGRLRSMVQ